MPDFLTPAIRYARVKTSREFPDDRGRLTEAGVRLPLRPLTADALRVEARQFEVLITQAEAELRAQGAIVDRLEVAAQIARLRPDLADSAHALRHEPGFRW